MQVLHPVLSGSELLENSDIFAGTPYRIHGHIELVCGVALWGLDEEWQLRERQFLRLEAGLDRARPSAGDCFLHGLGDEGAVLGNMLEGPVPFEFTISIQSQASMSNMPRALETIIDSLFGNAFEGRVVVETEVARVDDVVGLGFLCKVIQGSEVTCPHWNLSVCFQAKEDWQSSS